jgi:MinD-like ATPase involved in chromosome partitioning or flagellar assembly
MGSIRRELGSWYLLFIDGRNTFKVWGFKMFMSKTIGVISIKGGVGKTTIAASLAADLANHYGERVLLVDANYGAPNLGLHMDIVEPVKTIHDVLANKARALGAIHSRFGVDVIPGSYSDERKLNYMKLRDRLKSVSEKYDFVIIDSSPALNDEVLSTMLASDSLFVVTTPDYPTLSCSLKAARLAKQRGKPISGIIVNKIRDPKFEVSLRDIEGVMDIPVVARIPDDKSNVGALYTRIPTSVYNRRARFSKEISRLSAALTGGSEKRAFWGRVFGEKVRREQINRQVLKDNLRTLEKSSTRSYSKEGEDFYKEQFK